MGQQHISQEPEVHGAIEDNISGYETLVRDNVDGGYTLDVLVSGVHCAGCIQKIESSLTSQDHISHVRLNFSTRRLTFSWNGNIEEANDYVTLVEKLGYGVKPFDPYAEQEGTRAEEKFLLLCLGVAGFALGNIMLLSVGLWSTSTETMGFATRELMHWVSAAIALPVVLFSGRPFFYSAFKALKNGHTNMDVPISLAISLASLMSLYETINNGEHVYFDSAIMLLFFLLVGRYLDFRARKNARSAATDLMSTLSGFALVEEDGQKTRSIAIRDLKEGMIVRVAVGEKLPIDGEVISGQSEIDTSLVTGETVPRPVREGDEVYAGTMNMSAPMRVRVMRAAEDSLLSDIVRLMEKAEQGQAEYVRLADRMARAYTPFVHGLALIGFLGWWLLIGVAWQEALLIAVTILIITCPCALGLAVPVVQVLATGRLMREGILVKSGDALERLAKIDMFFVDKTGTLTHGKPKLQGNYDKAILKMTASLASYSHHPLSKALAENIARKFEISDVREEAGKGVSGIFKGQALKLGSRVWCGNESAPASENPEIWFAQEGEKPVQFTFTDNLRIDTKEVIEQMKNSGLDIILVSGDRERAVETVAMTLDIPFYAQKTPPEKFALLEEYKAKNHKVAMIGDGLNDAPVLAGADVSIAPGSAVDMAQNAADIVFMGDNFAPVYICYKIAVRAQKLVKQNFGLAILYNCIAVPMAFAGMVTPLVAALAMSGSSLIVIANSFRLKFK